MKYFAVLCGDVFRCIRHESAEIAATSCLCNAFLTNEVVGLAEVVEVVSQDGEFYEFDPQELMKEAGGIRQAKQQVELTERIREIMELPSDVNEIYVKASNAEICHHVKQVFGFDIEADDMELFAHRVAHEQAHSGRDTLRDSACRAFVWFAKRMSPEILHSVGLTEAMLGEWEPSSEPFNYTKIIDEDDEQ